MDTLTSLTYVITGVIDILLPLALGFYFTRRHKVHPRTIFHAAILYYAALVFVVIGIAIHNRLLPVRSMTFITYLTLGFTTAVIEEAVRYISLRFISHETRAYGTAVAFGIGWASMPTILIGLSLLLTPVTVHFFSSAQSMMNQTNSTQTNVFNQIEVYESTISDTVLTFLSATSMFIMQIAWTVALVTAINEKKSDKLKYAVGSHWAVNSGVYLFSQTHWMILSAFYLVATVAAVYWLRKLPE